MFSRFLNFQDRIHDLFDYAMQDAFYAPIVHDLIDYGHEIRFLPFGRAGVYRPYALATEVLDSAEKRAQFATGFWRKHDEGEMRARIALPLFARKGTAFHLFLHEVMHFYQDMLGLYFVPLLEEGRFPVMLDAQSTVQAILFNEAWAEVEAIRAGYALAQRAQTKLSRAYKHDLERGVDEAVAAARLFGNWHNGSYRIFYERHGLRVFDMNLRGFLKRSAFDSKNLRSLRLREMILSVPKEAVPKYFHLIDWEDDAFKPRIGGLNAYERAENPDVQDIFCGTPPYLWRRLRETTSISPAPSNRPKNSMM